MSPRTRRDTSPSSSPQPSSLLTEEINYPVILHQLVSSSNEPDSLSLSRHIPRALLQPELAGPTTQSHALRKNSADTSSQPSGETSISTSTIWGSRLRQRNQLVSTTVSTPSRPAPRDVRTSYYVDGPEAVKIISEYTLETTLNEQEHGETNDGDGLGYDEMDEPCFSLGDYVRIKRLPADNHALESGYARYSATSSVDHNEGIANDTDIDIDVTKLSPLAYRIIRIYRAEEVFASYRAKVEDELLDAALMEDSDGSDAGGDDTRSENMDKSCLVEQFAYQGWVYQLDRHTSRYVADFEWFREDMLVFDPVATQEGSGDVSDEDEDEDEDEDNETEQEKYPSSSSDKMSVSNESYNQSQDSDDSVDEMDLDSQSARHGDSNNSPPPPQSRVPPAGSRTFASVLPLRRLNTVSLSDMKNVWKNLW
ncbi:hypothetical protein B0A52_02108 [Exophiala mesophila]|uniref:Uncharacterized protein n=1 Tax=Exophiala mesophila TaxID=212818 RepID=A0A438NEV9_EXOME|nr:hypothetical protein B0A52_02108 [Exophiala mesophila]